METSPASTHASESITRIKLACQACQRKKIRCDRTFPCGQCQRSSLTCIPSSRKPRTRQHAGKRAVDSELRSRISKLENLVSRLENIETLSGEVDLPDESQSVHEQDHDRHPDHDDSKTRSSDSPSVTRYIGTPFWSTLTNEVQALRDALEEDESEEDAPSDTSPAVTTSGDTTVPTAALLVCSPGLVYVMPGSLIEPTGLMESELHKIYWANIDPVFKLLHRPTAQPFFDFGAPYLGHNADAAPNLALRAAVCFASLTSLSDSERLYRFHVTRAELLQQFRRQCDVALTRADLINSSELATLQAAVMYITASRLTDPSKKPWIMTGLLVRIAQGTSLQHEDPSHTPYEKETRRRLFHHIRVLDSFASIDRGSEILLPLSSFSVPPPSNVNDDDYDERSTSIPNREKGLSDTTFSMMAHEAVNSNMALLTPGSDSWQRRFETTQALSKTMNERYLRFCDRSRPFDRFLSAVGNSMIASSILRAVRPMQKMSGSVPPRLDSPFVLQLAVNSLIASQAIDENDAAAGWRWIFWVPWHALAVALAGLCSIRDTELARTAWELVEKAYERNSGSVADTKDGMLWKPIEKLYKKARAFRDGIESTPNSNASPPASSMNRPELSSRSRAPQADANQSLLSAQPDVQTGSVDPWAQSSSMDFTLGTMENLPDVSGLPDFSNGDLTWTPDWEKIMNDIATMPTSMLLGDLDINAMAPDLDYDFGGVRVPPDIRGGWDLGQQ